jgi:nicotinamide-nucleotide amidase
MNWQQQIDALAHPLVDHLLSENHVLVTAESCTAGLVSATLSRVPGVSRCLAGAWVVYQIESKVAWLQIPASFIDRYGVVSAEVAEKMALQSLALTPHATLSLGITGHLGPLAPPDLDGIAFLGIGHRTKSIAIHRLTLTSAPLASAISIRHQRQQSAVLQTLQILLESLDH